MEESKNKTRGKKTSKYDPFIFVNFLVIVLFGIIAVRLGYLQIFQAEKYSLLAENQRTQTADLLPRRGTVYLSEKGGSTFQVATTRKTASVYADPRLIKDVNYTVEKLTDIIFNFQKREEQRKQNLFKESGQYTDDEIRVMNEEKAKIPPEEIKKQEDQKRHDIFEDLSKRLSNNKDPYEPLVRYNQKLDEQAISEIKSADLSGIKMQDTYERYYPEDTLAAHVLGFVRNDGIKANGEYGVEGKLNEILQGRAGFFESEMDVAGRWISVGGRDLKPAQDGANVVLTIDRVVQTIAEQVAKDGQEKYHSERASIIVMDPNTGDITALANYPTFNPNYFGDIRNVSVLKNGAIFDLFEPGSIFKPIIMAIAMDLGLVTPDTTMEDNGPLKIGKYTINTFNGKHLGRITMTQILEQSNNVGMAWVADRVGADRLYEGLRRFGVGDRTGIPLDSESSKALPEPGQWKKTNLATIGFGQGIVLTPLQVLAADTAVVNGGKLLEPHIIKEIQYSDGTKETTNPRIIRQVISKETSTKVTAMLTSVVENGVAGLAKVKGYYVGGKTGTAQVADPKTGRYSADRKIISFFGFAPSENPKFVVLIVLDNPEGLSFASGTAAPMFHDLAQKLLDYYTIPPNRSVVDDPLKKIR